MGFHRQEYWSGLPFPSSGDLPDPEIKPTSPQILYLATSEVKFLSHVRLFVILWTVAYQASPSMRFSRQEYQSGLPFPSPGELPDPGIEPRSPTLQADTLPSERETTREAL